MIPFYSLCEIKMQIMFDYFEHFLDEALLCEHLVKFSKTESEAGNSSDSGASI